MLRLALPCRRLCTPGLAPHRAFIRPIHSTSPTPLTASRIWSATHRRVAQWGRARPPTPPPRPNSFWRQIARKINAIPTNIIFWGIFAINGTVFILWNVAITQYKSSGDPYTINVMRENFTTSMNNIRNGRYWTLITSSFSQKDFSHILFNLFSYYYTAPAILYTLGNTGFLALYLGAGLCSSLTSLWWNSSVKNHPGYSSHGASGALCGMLSFFACLAPFQKFHLFGILPLPAWLCVGGIFAIDGYSAVTDKRSGVDVTGHLGGIIAGIGYYILRLRLGR